MMIFISLMNHPVLLFQAGADWGCRYQPFTYCPSHTALNLCNSAIDVAAQAAGTAISTELFYVNVNCQ